MVDWTSEVFSFPGILGNGTAAVDISISKDCCGG